MKRSTKAFTLIELLVVLCIGALLLAILLPSIARAREFSKRAVCSNNIRQMGLSFVMYAQNNQSFPTVYAPTTAGTYEDNPQATATKYTSPKKVESLYYKKKVHAGDPMACLWLLVLEGQMTPRSFICPSDPYTTATPSAQYYSSGPNSYWYDNFGGNGTAKGPLVTPGIRGAGESYSIACPWYKRSIAPWWTGNGTAGSDVPLVSDMAPAKTANKNYPKSSAKYRDPGQPQQLTGGYVTPKVWNSGNHAGDGQNIGWGDDHVSWHNNPFAGDNGDNIFTASGQAQVSPVTGTFAVTISGNNVGIDARWTAGTPGSYDTVMLPVQDISEWRVKGGF